MRILVQWRTRNHISSCTMQPRSRTAIPYVPGGSVSVNDMCSVDFQRTRGTCSHAEAERGTGASKRLTQKREVSGHCLQKIPCTNCDFVYIGDSENCERLLKDHNNDVKKRNAVSSTFAEHVSTCDRKVEWDKASVITIERNWHSCQYLGLLLIQATQKRPNRNDGNLPLTYARCLAHITKWLSSLSQAIFM